MTFPRQARVRSKTPGSTDIFTLAAAAGQTVYFDNLSESILTGLTATVSHPPTALAVQATVPATLVPDGNATVDVPIVATSNDGFAGPVIVEVKSAEGARALLQLKP